MEKTTETKLRGRNYSLDIVKGIVCVFIVFMHCEFPGKLYVVFQSAARFSVPFFFMVSGYFCYKESGKVDYWKKIKHIGVITLCASLFYLIITPVYSSGERLSFSASDLVGWIVFNQPVYIAGQLWFLFSLLYDYILFAIIDKLNIRKFVYKAIPFQIALYILCAQGAHLMGIDIPSLYYRNFLIEGLPLFALGCYIHENQDKLRFSNRTLIACFVIFTLLCPVERLIMRRSFGINIMTFVQLVSLFLLCVKNPDIRRFKPIYILGNRYSLYVYVFHPALWHILDRIYENQGIDGNTAALYAKPFICTLCAIAISVAYVALKNKIIPKKV